MRYESTAQFDRAVKRSIKDSGRDPGVAYREMLRDRFLCRVFSEDDPRFLLKGGSGMLARIPDARATKDVDFAARGRETAESAIDALDELASKGLVDIVTYATNEPFDLLQLRHAVRCECAKRGMAVPDRFSAPDGWSVRFAAYARKDGLSEERADFQKAALLASRFLDPALSEAVPDEAMWNPAKTEWIL